MTKRLARSFESVLRRSFRTDHQFGQANQPPVFENLEPRQFLSASPAVRVQAPRLHHNSIRAAATTSNVAGYSPAEIAAAYGFNTISFDGGTVAANGAGQTIAIVDAYSDPNLRSDLSVFDRHFGISAPPSLKIVDQTGSSTLPTADPGWAAEISLDVEWAHAMAPQAGILLVEADAATNADLLAAANFARRAADVSVVSMSWGGSEFVSYKGSETPSERALDKTFATPAHHTGVTFIASAGDTGSANGVQWPGSSPNVVSVGGTTLETNSSGSYFGEQPWKGFSEGTSGGFSKVEPEPGYQKIAQQSGKRGIPDVAYDANPNSGFAVYDSYADAGVSGWQVVGGTSAGAPQWAALIAIADQGRALAGMGTLDGTSETLPALYSVYSAAGTSGYADYTAYFNNIGSDGYGISTGLGSPKAPAIASLLEGLSPASFGATPIASPVDISFASSPPSSAAIGSSKPIRLRITNTESTPFGGQITLHVYASTDGTISSADTTLTTVTLRNFSLSPLGSKIETLNLKYPKTMGAGSYDLIVSATAAGDSPTQVVSAAPMSIAAATSKG